MAKHEIDFDDAAEATWQTVVDTLNAQTKDDGQGGQIPAYDPLFTVDSYLTGVVIPSQTEEYARQQGNTQKQSLIDKLAAITDLAKVAVAIEAAKVAVDAEIAKDGGGVVVKA